MVTSQQCLKKYGAPELERNMVVFDVPANMEIGFIPKKVYCNKDLVAPLTQGLRNLIDRKLVGELRSWDGCFNIRKKRGQSTASLHSWGAAFDVNAAWNPFGGKPTLSAAFVKCFTDAGLEWGGTWSKADGMHFQLAKI